MLGVMSPQKDAVQFQPQDDRRALLWKQGLHEDRKVQVKESRGRGSLLPDKLYWLHQRGSEV